MKRIAFAIALFATPAFAQQMSPEQAAAGALGQQIGYLAHENGQLRSQLAKAAADLAAAQEKIKELEKKAEPAK